MKRTSLLVAALFLAGSFAAALAAETPAAEADLINPDGDSIGTVQLTQVSNGVKISADLSDLSPGMHAFHIHGTGKCEPPDFKSAGGHFNPEGKKHGLKNPDGPHAGDMENIEVGEDGTAHVEVVNTRVTLGEGKNSLFQAAGTAIVIHAKGDDNMSDPAGNAGPRVACGVIEKSEDDD